jgi:hypothetical protein
MVVATANGACPWFVIRDRLFGRREVRTGRYLSAAEITRQARNAGLSPIDVRTWGAAPPGLTFGPAVRILDALEVAAVRLHLSRYLGVLTAGFRKPA